MILKKSKFYISSEGLLILGDEQSLNISSSQTSKSITGRLPKPLTINSDKQIKRKINSLFKKLISEMERNYPGMDPSVIYRNFKLTFKIKNNKWKVIFEYPIGCSSEILDYIENRYNNIVLGKNFNRNYKRVFIHPKNFMYRRETDLLAEIGLSTKSDEVKKILSEFFEVSSHTQLSINQHWQFVKYLEAIVES